MIKNLLFSAKFHIYMFVLRRPILTMILFYVCLQFIYMAFNPVHCMPTDLDPNGLLKEMDLFSDIGKLDYEKTIKYVKHLRTKDELTEEEKNIVIELTVLMKSIAKLTSVTIPESLAAHLKLNEILKPENSIQQLGAELYELYKTKVLPTFQERMDDGVRVIKLLHPAYMPQSIKIERCEEIPYNLIITGERTFVEDPDMREDFLGGSVGQFFELENTSPYYTFADLRSSRDFRVDENMDAMWVGEKGIKLMQDLPADYKRQYELGFRYLYLSNNTDVRNNALLMVLINSYFNQGVKPVDVTVINADISEALDEVAAQEGNINKPVADMVAAAPNQPLQTVALPDTANIPYHGWSWLVFSGVLLATLTISCVAVCVKHL